MAYLAYHFKVNPPQPGSEILMALIGELGFESFDDTADGFIAYIREENAVDIDPARLKFDDFTYSFERELMPDTNWNAEWERNFDPVKVDDLLNIRAPFHTTDPQVKEEIVIMPKMSFGTGHHQTTRMMCRELFRQELHGKRVLDMGCGTGILAILAKKRGAATVTGIDIDEWSVENAVENCALNGYPDIKIMKGDASLLKDEKPYDYILANINKNILRRDLPVYANCLLPGGKVLLSGFFITDKSELTEVANRCGLMHEASQNENEWAMMVFSKPD